MNGFILYIFLAVVAFSYSVKNNPTTIVKEQEQVWLPVNNNHKDINVAVNDKDANSILNYFRKMVNLRKQNEILVYGAYDLLDAKNKNVYHYELCTVKKCW